MLVAAGRTPNTRGIGLEQAGIELTGRGYIRVNDRLETTAPTLRKCCWPTAVPIEPGDVPITADGFLVNAFWPHGLLAQSIAFLSAPGIERLYSGVTNRTASTLAMASLNRFATSG